jgi:hypothetical protein
MIEIVLIIAMVIVLLGLMMLLGYIFAKGLKE